PPRLSPSEYRLFVLLYPLSSCKSSSVMEKTGRGSRNRRVLSLPLRNLRCCELQKIAPRDTIREWSGVTTALQSRAKVCPACFSVESARQRCRRQLARAARTAWCSRGRPEEKQSRTGRCRRSPPWRVSGLAAT